MRVLSYPARRGDPSETIEKVDERHRTVLKVNEGFYRAFESGRIEDMLLVWSGTDSDRCIHPGWPILEGWDAIRSSWEGIFRGTRDIHVELESVRVQVHGDTACVTCIEHFTGVAERTPVSATVAATNLYRWLDERWVLVHHHGSPIHTELPASRSESDRTIH